MNKIVSAGIGGLVAVATMFGLVNAQTSTPTDSAANVSDVGLNYGSR